VRARTQLNRVCQYIDTHLDQPLTVDRLAAVACLSPCHFSRTFKQVTGIRLHRYIMQRRVARAKILIAEDHETLAVIARMAGFADQSHLTAVFHQITGITPGMYRARILLKDLRMVFMSSTAANQNERPALG
jgi:AraC family transcriptional regulator